MSQLKELDWPKAMHERRWSKADHLTFVRLKGRAIPKVQAALACKAEQEQR
jgi:hypothetical protein